MSPAKAAKAPKAAAIATKPVAPVAAPLPQGWAAGIIGHEAVIGVLDRAAASGRLTHAYLLTGPEGAGKSTLARRLAAALLGSAPDTHPDFSFVERERDAKTGKPHAFISIDQTQALTARLAHGSMMGGWRVAILDGAHLLNDASANALLKRLEEPSEKTLLILTATRVDQVIATIRSRCQLLRFERVATPLIIASLAAKGVRPEDAELYGRLADGRPGVALAYAADRSALTEMFALRDAILSMPSAAIADRFAAIERAVPPKLPFLDAVDRSRGFANLAAELLRDALLIRLGLEDRIVHVDARERLTEWARTVNAAAALALLEDSRRLFDANVSPRAALERVVAAF